METRQQRLERCKFILVGLNGLNKDNIEKHFGLTFDTWLYRNSHDTEMTTNDKYLRPNLEGEKLTNVSYSGVDKNGIKLTENHFIDEELSNLATLKYDLLSSENKRVFQLYKEFLEDKLKPKTNKKPLNLKDFLADEKYIDKLPQIAEKFKNSIGAEMAKAVFILQNEGVFTYDYNSKTKGRKQLVEILNPNAKMNGVNKWFVPNTIETIFSQDDLTNIKKWFSGL